MKRWITIGTVAALLALAACSTSDPPAAGGDPAYGQAQDGTASARAEYEAYARLYARRKQALRMQEWQAIQQRAQEQMAEKQRQNAIRRARVQQRWQSFQ
jgi:hypothetical protein